MSRNAQNLPFTPITLNGSSPFPPRKFFLFFKLEEGGGELGAGLFPCLRSIMNNMLLHFLSKML